MVCGLPSSSTSKSSVCSPATAFPLLLVTTTSTSTRRTLLLTVGTAFPESEEAVWGWSDRGWSVATTDKSRTGQSKWRVRHRYITDLLDLNLITRPRWLLRFKRKT